MLRSLLGTGTGLALAVALLVGPARAAEADKFLPANTTGVVSVNVRQLVDSPLVKKHFLAALKADLKDDAELQKMLTTTGIDPFQDVSRVTLASWGAAADKVLVIAHGRFDVTKAEAAAADYARKNPKELKITEEGGTHVYQHTADKGSYFAAFVDRETAVASESRSAVLDAVKSGGRTPAKLHTDLQGLIARADDQQTVWLAALTPAELKKAMSRNDNTRDIADKINAFTGQVDVRKDVDVALHVHTADAKTADSVSDLLDNVKGLAKLVAQNNPRFGKMLGGILDDVKIATDKGNVDLTVKVSEETIEKGLKEAGQKPKP